MAESSYQKRQPGISCRPKPHQRATTLLKQSHTELLHHIRVNQQIFRTLWYTPGRIHIIQQTPLYESKQILTEGIPIELHSPTKDESWETFTCVWETQIVQPWTLKPFAEKSLPNFFCEKKQTFHYFVVNQRSHTFFVENIEYVSDASGLIYIYLRFLRQITECCEDSFDSGNTLKQMVELINGNGHIKINTDKPQWNPEPTLKTKPKTTHYWIQ